MNLYKGQLLQRTAKPLIIEIIEVLNKLPVPKVKFKMISLGSNIIYNTPRAIIERDFKPIGTNTAFIKLLYERSNKGK